ncbi:thioredoxin family protein [Verrucomicrobiaceae bacterium N1E253]|uniref:Thioredoxin family protein n=1 Tax=Oceaniferula marina TaxID=2748318 RepID=A0A851GK06_9BACT|nr:thioredoxin family protein [Oceaniferula marina]NWK54504.1 thioredoxin family protein [Oceaniferula marina]
MPISLSAAPTSADNWPEALKLAKQQKKDIVLFVHGSNWNRLGEKFKTKIWDQTDFKSELADAVISCRVDYREGLDEDEKKAFNESIKGLKLKFRSYPVLALYDPEGRMIAQWCGSDFPLMASQALGLIEKGIQQRAQRDALIAQASSQQGIEKAESLYDAIQTGTGMRAELLKLMREADPNDQSGLIKILELNGRKTMGRANQLIGEKKYEEALQWLDEQAQISKLSAEQKQWILAAKGNVYRRWGNHLPEMERELMAAYALDKESPMGKASYRLAKRFAGPVSLDYGWDSRHCSDTPVTWKIDVGDRFKQPGTYEVKLQYKRGKSALSIDSVSLYQGGALVVEDRHRGSTGHQSKNNTYLIRLDQPVSKGELHIVCSTDSSKNSQGVIEVKARSSEN